MMEDLMIGEWFKLTVLSSGSLVGVYIVFGLILDRIEKLNIHYIASSLGKMGIMLTGCIGTVVHEFSHFVMCLLFGHRIVEVAWFRPIKGMKDGVLGYVQHSYTPTSLYQQVGNFFIGIAPMLLGSIFILILFRVCVPKASRYYTAKVSEQMQAIIKDFTVGNIIKGIFSQIGALFKALWTKENIQKPSFWVFIIIAYSISTHMSLSLADLQGALTGLGVVLIGIVIISLILSLIHLPVKKIVGLLIKYNVLLIGVFTMSISFSLMTLLISAIIYRIL
ncbi:MAG: hypothetical protein J6F30_07360 [Cellulosilyticum sp.]|nr:hypothetical protein [Cellulosilyticum sp.]